MNIAKSCPFSEVLTFPVGQARLLRPCLSQPDLRKTLLRGSWGFEGEAELEGQFTSKETFRRFSHAMSMHPGQEHPPQKMVSRGGEIS